MLSERAKHIDPSLTLEITSRAKKMKKEGRDVLILAAGEPDFPTPERIKKKAFSAIENNFTTYTAASGIPELKEAIKKKFLRDNNLEYKSEEIMANCGGKQALYLAFQCLLDAGDRAVVTIPYWNSYIEQIKLACGIPVTVATFPDMSFDIDAIINAMRDAKVLLLNSPCNPSGYVLSRRELEAIGEEVLKNKNLFVISDEVYEYLVYDGEHISIASLSPELKKRTLVVNAVSKSYAMTGWRLGYAAGPGELITAMGYLQGHMTSNPTSISQMAAVEALEGDQTDVNVMVGEFKKRRNFLIEHLQGLPLIKVYPPKGTFYAFVDISETGMTSLEFANRLLDEVLVAVIPGGAFGMDNFVRLSFASGMEEIEGAVERIGKFLKNLDV